VRLHYEPLRNNRRVLDLGPLGTGSSQSQKGFLQHVGDILRRPDPTQQIGVKPVGTRVIQLIKGGGIAACESHHQLLHHSSKSGCVDKTRVVRPVIRQNPRNLENIKTHTLF
jgi:hypothetical protein